MSFSVAWDESSPSGSQDISLGDDRIREFKTQFRERYAVDHHMPSADDADTGTHEKVTFLGQSSDPLQYANALILYTKSSGGVRELYSRHETAASQQLTLNGQLWIPALTILNQTQGDLVKFDGSVFNRLQRGSALQILRVNSLGTDLEYFTASFTAAAAQADMEAATDNTLVVTPYVVKNHPGVAKAWCVFNGATAGTNAPTAGYNVTSVQRNSQGNYTINFTVPFSSGSYSASGMANDTGGTQPVFQIVGSPGASSITVKVINAGGVVQDQTFVALTFHGDQ